MAYGFNANKSKETVYTESEVDELLTALSDRITELETVYEYQYTNDDLDTDYYAIYSNTTMKIRRTGNVVHLYGTLELVEGWTFTATPDSPSYPFGLSVAETALGVKLRPSNVLHFVCNGSGSAKWVLNVPSDTSDCYITRYNDYKDTTSNYSYADDGTYMPFSATWIVVDD